jgi:methionyl-tRNA formyltransferase
LLSKTATQKPGTILRADKEGIVVSCGEGELAIEVLQLEGGKPLEAKQLLSAYQALFAAGKHFTLPVASVGK